MSLKNLGLAALLSLAALPALAQTQTVRIGATPGPHAQILEAVKPIAAKKGLDIKIVEFSDYVVPNAALAGGDLEANSFQHQPYLDNQVADRGYKIESVGADRELPDRHLFEEAQEPRRAAERRDDLDPERSDQWRPRAAPPAGQGPDQAQGRRRLQADASRRHRQPEEAQVRRDRSRPGARACSTTWMPPSSTPTTRRQAGLDPVKDAIARENPKGPYVNIIAVRSEDKDKPWVKALVEVLPHPRGEGLHRGEVQGLGSDLLVSTALPHDFLPKAGPCARPFSFFHWICRTNLDKEVG